MIWLEYLLENLITFTIMWNLCEFKISLINYISYNHQK